MKTSLKSTLSFVIYFFISIYGLNAQTKDKIVIAQDGSGDYSTIQEALNACSLNQSEQVIYIKNGIYKEKLVVESNHLHFIGESKDSTIISYADYSGKDGIRTSTSYTLKVTGDYISFENLTIENTAGSVGQAVALHLEGDCFSIKNCKLLGDQDTVYTGGKNTRHYFYNCYIEGTTDYIFGSSTAVFNKCIIHSKKNSYITAANTPQETKHGYLFLNCKLTAQEDITKVYLGRPWRDYAQVVYINCEMGNHIRPEGWHNWSKPEREKTAFYAEYNNSGPGAKTEQRVEWSHQLTKKQAKEYKLKNLFNNEIDWILK